MRNTFLLITFFFLIGCTPSREKRCIQASTDCLTMFENRDSQSRSWTVIASGFHQELPNENFVSVRNKWSDGWQLLAEWQRDTLYIYQPYPYINEERSNMGNIKILNMTDTDFYKIFYSKKQDSLLVLDRSWLE